MQDFVNQIWYQKHPLRWLLWPLSWLFGAISAVRRVGFRLGLKSTIALPVPVIVVGNITAGGSGKTPTVIYLIELLRRHGYTPGVISRGYGAKIDGVLTVALDAKPADVGDEPAMIVARTQVPMVVGAKRIEAAQHLLASSDVDVIICDDGLQHYQLARDIELAIVDGKRRLGNGWLLPAGPLREGAWRLDTVDFVINNGGESQGREHLMTLVPEALAPVAAYSSIVPPNADDAAVAMAGIGNPERFFTTLNELGFYPVKTQGFADHQAFSPDELIALAGDLPLLMTEKDAVKCREFAQPNWWFLAVNAKLPSQFDEQLLSRLQEVVLAKKGKHHGV